MRAPDQLTIEDINRYQLYLTENKKVSWSYFNQAVCAIRFFYLVSLQMKLDIRHIPYQKTGRKLPEILSREEIESLFNVTTNIKHRSILMTTYSAGLRVGEVLNLRASDIDSQRMVIRVEQAKGRQDRYVMLSEKLLPTLREYWERYKPRLWLFEGRCPNQQLHRRSVQKTFNKARAAAGINKKVTTHSLRHAFATHLLEDGTNIRVIQRLLGHKSLHSTEIYTHVAKNYLAETRSPMDLEGDR